MDGDREIHSFGFPCVLPFFYSIARRGVRRDGEFIFDFDLSFCGGGKCASDFI